MLRKTQLIISIFLVYTSLFAQDALNNGVYTLSGAVTYSKSNSSISFADSFSDIDSESEYLRIGVSPSIGYFIIDNLLLKSNFNFLYSENSTNYMSVPGNTSSTNIMRSYTIGIGLKYYFRLNGFNPFIGADYGYSNETTGDNDGNTYTFAVGLNYFISKSVALEPFVQYLTSSSISSMKLFGDGTPRITYENSEISFGIRVAYFVVD